MTIREKALEFATKAHEGQFRKDGVTPYIEHPKAVAEIALDLVKYESLSKEELDILYIVALLHDTVEDTDFEIGDIYAEFGDRVAFCVEALTKKTGENYLEAILRAKIDLLTRYVKRADNIHNMSDLKEGSLKDKYRLSKYILEH